MADDLVYNEWRVTADHKDPAWRESMPAYDFTFSEQKDPNAETAARNLVGSENFQRSMVNIRVWHRFVTVSEWKKAPLVTSAQWFASLTWTCHVCGDERPDERISVASATFRITDTASGQVNRRYCNDRPACGSAARVQAAEIAARFQQVPHSRPAR